MALSKADRHSERLLSEEAEAGLRLFLRQFFGSVLFVLALAGWLSLLTWSITDPSFSHATNQSPTNLLGFGGAILSDLLFQFLGFGAIFVFAVPAIWGVQMMTGVMVERGRLFFLFWPLAVLALAAALTGLPKLASWPLPNGYGGTIGKMVIDGIHERLGSRSGFANLKTYMIVATLLGLFFLRQATGLRLKDIRVLLPDRESALRRSFRTGLAFGLNYLFTRKPRVKRRSVREMMRPQDVLKPQPQTAQAHEPPPLQTNRRPGMGAPLPESHVTETLVAFPQLEEWDDDAPIPEGIKPDHGHEAPRSRRPFSIRDALGRIEPKLEDYRQPDPDEPKVHDFVPANLPPNRRQRRRRTAPVQPMVVAKSVHGFLLPPLSLLQQPAKKTGAALQSPEQLQQNAELLEATLKDFGVHGQIVGVNAGPVVTLYEFEPARGTKSARVIGLAEDIARSMSTVSARIAVIPGRNAIGIEIPNGFRETVYLRELLETQNFMSNDAKLALAMGQTIAGESVVVDLARMPHLLMAGTTGSGKSVGINTMILSLLYRMTPEQCKFIMIDPKMLELSVYDGIPHLLSPVVTDPTKAVVALKWTVREMEERYKNMSKLGVRNIDNYNTKIEEYETRGEPISRTVQTGFDRETGQAIYEQEVMDLNPMPYIVVVIDEMADLMMVAGKDIENAVQRLAQMARAAGIHLITATQRPSVDVITGTIKANFPTRVSFQVTTKIDSRTILGEQGAEQLLGSGDMLYMASGSRSTRVHGPFVSDLEVELIVNHLKAQGGPQYLEDVTAEVDAEGGNEGEGTGEKDALFQEAVAIVRRDQRASTSYLQRRLSIGYNRAATLIERLEEAGIVSPANHAGKRQVLIDPDPAFD
ncbi:MAG: DNA translocase FtsK 4TM domain-containing protein [Methyloligellaceae bacterium]